MVLLLCTHIVEIPSSRVPLAVIILNDAVKRKLLPPNLKCRVVIPSCGNYSSSIWDASSPEELQAWIDNNLMDGTVAIAEIPEEFTYGLALELTTSRAADKVATTSRSTLERINTTGSRVMESMSEKLDQLDARTNLITATREATSAAAAKVKQATNSAMENESVQKSLQSLSYSFQNASNRMGQAFTWVGSKVKEQFPASAASAGGAQSYSGFASDGGTAPPPYEDSPYSAPAAYMPVSTHAARASNDAAVEAAGGGGGAWGGGAGAGPVTEDDGPMPQFTLDDSTISPAVTPAKETAPAKEQEAAAAVAAAALAPEEAEEEEKENRPQAAAGGGEGTGTAPAPATVPAH